MLSGGPKIQKFPGKLTSSTRAKCAPKCKCHTHMGYLLSRNFMPTALPRIYLDLAAIDRVALWACLRQRYTYLYLVSVADYAGGAVFVNDKSS